MRSGSKIIKKLFMEYRNLSLTVKAGIWFTFCGFAQRGLSFITTPIFTRIMTTQQYGVVSVYNSWEQVLLILCSFNLFYGGFNNGMRDYKNKRNEYLSIIQGLITNITVVWFVIYLIGRRFWNQILEMDTYLVIILFIQIIAQSALLLWSGKERFEFKYKSLVTITFANTFFGTILPIFTILLLGKENAAETKIVTHASVVIIFGGGLYIYNLFKGTKFFNGFIWKNAFLFNLPLLPHYLSTMILNQADRIMISKMVGNGEAGIYSVAYSAAMILNIFVTSINHTFAPWIYGELDNNRFEDIKKVSNTLFAGIALVLMLLIAFAPECIAILAGRKYVEAVKIIPSVAVSLYFIFMYQIFANVEFYFKKNKFIAYASVSGAVLNIVLNYIGIQLFGYIAAGYTTLICYIVFGIAHYLFMRRICKECLSDVRLFDSRIIFFIALGLIAFAMVMTVLYDHILGRYITLIVIVMIILLNRKKIMQQYRILKRNKS